MESSLNDYMVGAAIGQGNFGTVYHGMHKETNRDVAIKLYDKISLQKRPMWLDAVLTEQRILRKLAGCPFVATLLASFHDDQFVYLVLKFFSKGTLSHYLEKKCQLEDQVWLSHAVRIALGINAAIEALHGYGVIHADLKPDNLLMTEDLSNVVLTDFGSALTIPTYTQTRDSVPENILMRGTAEYAAPELIRRNCTPTTAVDLWSFGCLLHTLWTGKSPFHADSEALIVDKVVGYANGDTSFTDFGTQIPPNVLGLVKQLLDPNPENRTCCGSDSAKSILESTDEFKEEFLINGSDFVLSDPAWDLVSSRSAMKDGALGWGVFL